MLQEVHDALLSIEAEAERMFNAERSLMDGDTQERDQLYTRAQKVRLWLVAVSGRAFVAWHQEQLQDTLHITHDRTALQQGSTASCALFFNC